MDLKEDTNYIIVPPEKLPPETLNALIDSFILREGTDYGFNEISLEEKHKQVKKQMDQGDIYLVFNLLDESISLIQK